MSEEKPLVSISMGSDSDLPIMEEAKKILDGFEIPNEIIITSAHRTPNQTQEYATSAKERGIKVLIAGAGHAAHLAGVLAANTILPVIGVPIDSSALKGMDSLLATAQMPGGVPVATMAIGKGGAKNAGLLAVQILALHDSHLEKELVNYKEKMAKAVQEKNKKLQSS